MLILRFFSKTEANNGNPKLVKYSRARILQNDNELQYHLSSGLSTDNVNNASRR